MKSPILRATIRFMASVARAPQPVKVVSDKASAYAFARDELLEARAWVGH